MTCVKHATDYSSFLAVPWAPVSPFKSRIPATAEGTHTSCHGAVTSSHGLHCLSFCSCCIVLPRFTFLPWSGITTDAPLVTKLQLFPQTQLFMADKPERALINYLPSTSVTIASTSAVLQLELIMSINCLKGKLQQKPTTCVLSLSQLLQITLHPLPGTALVKLK